MSTGAPLAVVVYDVLAALIARALARVEDLLSCTLVLQVLLLLLLLLLLQYLLSLSCYCGCASASSFLCSLNAYKGVSVTLYSSGESGVANQQ